MPSAGYIASDDRVSRVAICENDRAQTPLGRVKTDGSVSGEGVWASLRCWPQQGRSGAGESPPSADDITPGMRGKRPCGRRRCAMRRVRHNVCCSATPPPRPTRSREDGEAAPTALRIPLPTWSTGSFQPRSSAFSQSKGKTGFLSACCAMPLLCFWNMEHKSATNNNIGFVPFFGLQGRARKYVVSSRGFEPRLVCFLHLLLSKLPSVCACFLSTSGYFPPPNVGAAGSCSRTLRPCGVNHFNIPNCCQLSVSWMFLLPHLPEAANMGTSSLLAGTESPAFVSFQFSLSCFFRCFSCQKIMFQPNHWDEYSRIRSWPSLPPTRCSTDSQLLGHVTLLRLCCVLLCHRLRSVPQRHHFLDVRTSCSWNPA